MQQITVLVDGGALDELILRQDAVLRLQLSDTTFDARTKLVQADAQRRLFEQAPVALPQHVLDDRANRRGER